MAVERMRRGLLGGMLLFAGLAGGAGAVVPAAPQVDAESHLLVDYHTGRVMAESNADARLEPASLTKMMTVYVVLAELRAGKITMADEVRISEKAWRSPGSRSFVEVDERVSVEVLLKGVIIQSGNDASIALAEHVAGDETAFASLMNQYAARLGMDDSHFVNSSGLPDEGHYSTARDLARVAAALIRDFPELYPWHAIKVFEYNNIKQYNRNKLLWRDESVDGLKTGYTRAAGYCLVASAERDGMRLISVVMGAKSEKLRTRFSEALLNYGFRFYETHLVYAARKPITEIRVWQGDRENLGIGVRRDLFVTVPRGEYGKLDARIEVMEPVIAPIARGTATGRVRVSLGEEAVAERTLIALDEVPDGNLWQQVRDYVWLWFN